MTAYREGVEYAVKTLGKKAPSATMYVDASHGGWLGWPADLKKYISMVQVRDGHG